MKDVIIALDFKNFVDTRDFINQFNEPLYVKVGMELFYAEGVPILQDLKKRGHQIFLDLKLHDIPNTVKSAMRNLAKLGIDMVNVHASGTVPMMEAAMAGLEEGTPQGSKRPICIAVTQLTSTTEAVMQTQLLINETLPNTVLKYARLTQAAGLDGVVCSALEVEVIHNHLGLNFITCTPGIRLATDQMGDQKRVVTPEKARELGSDFIVVGRSITGAQDPVATYESIKNQFLGVSR